MFGFLLVIYQQNYNFFIFKINLYSTLIQLHFWINKFATFQFINIYRIINILNTL